MADHAGEPRALERVQTGVAGLDTVLRGGLFRSGIYMVMGRPGTGKTTLGSQIAFNHVAAGGRALFVTLLTDSHDRMFAALAPMHFFDASVLMRKLQYLSAYQVLEQEKLPGLLKQLRNTVKDFSASLLVIDGIVTAEAMAENELDMKKFLHELQVLVELFRCTAILLTGARSDDDAHYAERTMVDGLLQLTMRNHGMRPLRQIEVLKHRGSAGLLGPHVFEITSDGITVYPRVESHLGRAPAEAKAWAPLSTGIAALDTALGGGIAHGAASLVVGAPGSGKTLLGLHFLAEGAARGESGLYFGFNEAPDAIRAMAARAGLDIDRGVELAWEPPVEQNADILCSRILTRVGGGHIRRVVIDGIESMLDGLIQADRARSFLPALANELRVNDVTSMWTQETLEPFGAASDAPTAGYWAGVDNVLLLRYAEGARAGQRTLAVAKARSAKHSSSLLGYSIGSSGIEFLGRSSNAGSARPRGAPRKVSRKKAKPGGRSRR